VTEFTPAATPGRSAVEPVDIAANLRFVKNTMDGGLSGPTIKIYRLPQLTS
jgi:hypothetical protein